MEVGAGHMSIEVRVAAKLSCWLLFLVRPLTTHWTVSHPFPCLWTEKLKHRPGTTRACCPQHLHSSDLMWLWNLLDGLLKGKSLVLFTSLTSWR